MISLSPNIFVQDMKASIAFYSLLDFQLVNQVPPDTDAPVWAMLQCEAVTLMLQTYQSLGDELPDIRRDGGSGMLLYVQVKGIRELFSRIQSQVDVLKGLERTFYGATEFTIRDKNNYVWTFAEDEVTNAS
jgi:uncharacterized glyoxalase superfamily protein PhnB